jgi:hypothetical protein
MTGTPILASCRDAVTVDVPRLTAVATLARSVCAVITPEMVATQGGATVLASGGRGDLAGVRSRRDPDKTADLPSPSRIYGIAKTKKCKS